jgi:cytochrome c6
MRKFSMAAIVLLALIASCSKKTTAPTTDAKTPADGAQVFAGSCARCHGPEGVKDSRTPNLQTIDLDKAGLVKSITYGKGHMPAFEDKLSTEEISAVADLIVSWHKK